MDWEYETIRFDKMKFISSSLDIGLLNEKLNFYGEKGWELVSLETTTTFLGGQNAVVAVFKRPKQ